MNLHEAYSVLGLPYGSSKDTVRRKYKVLSWIHHPDRGGCEEKQKRLNEARLFLSQNATESISWCHDDKLSSDTARDMDIVMGVLGSRLGDFIGHIKRWFAVESFQVDNQLLGNSSFEIVISILTSNGEVLAEMHGHDGSISCVSSVYHKRRIHRVFRRKFKTTSDPREITPRFLFPERTMKRISCSQADAVMSKREFAEIMRRELNSKHHGKDTWIPLDGKKWLLIVRYKLGGKGAWTINGVYDESRMRRISNSVGFDIVTLFEDQDSFDRLSGVIKQLENS